MVSCLDSCNGDINLAILMKNLNHQHTVCDTIVIQLIVVTITKSFDKHVKKNCC